jgi:hypothetical protein
MLVAILLMLAGLYIDYYRGDNDYEKLRLYGIMTIPFVLRLFVPLIALRCFGDKRIKMKKIFCLRILFDFILIEATLGAIFIVEADKFNWILAGATNVYILIVELIVFLTIILPSQTSEVITRETEKKTRKSEYGGRMTNQEIRSTL